MANDLLNLAIYPHIPDIVSRLQHASSGFLVLTAETGSGKSTGMPVGLLQAFSGKIYLLEPRRIAAVSVAGRIAALLGEPVGKTVGYRVHGEVKVSAETRLEVITEAILIRLLQDNPLLDGVSCVVLDEFHERSVYADLALAFLKESVQLSENLKILVMSATIDADALSRHLDCAVVSVPGRAYPVEVVYAPQFLPEEKRFGLPDVAAGVAAAVKSVARTTTGVILCFLPGISDLTRCHELLAGYPVDILHSSVPLQEQQRILYGPSEGLHVILATSIAETSLTVPGVTTVIDCGLSRISRLDAASGMNCLNTEIETEFSAGQRKGRAGRVQEGTCIRLWNPSDVRVNHALPQVQIADLVPVVLECAVWGARSITDLDWLDIPNTGVWQQASAFLQSTGCIADDGAVTAKGKQIAALDVHPRVALVALEYAAGNDAALEYAAKLGAMSSSGGGESARREEKRLLNELQFRLGSVQHGRTGKSDTSVLPGVLCLLAGFYDRLAFHQGNGVYQLYTGRQATLAPELAGRYANDTAYPKWIIVTASDSGDRAARIYDFEPVPSSDAFSAWLDFHTVESSQVVFADEKRSVKKTLETRVGHIVVRTRPVPADPQDRAEAWCTLAAEKGLKSLPWNDECDSFLLRSRFYQEHGGINNGSPDTNGNLEFRLCNPEYLKEWLAPFITTGPLTAETVLQALRYALHGDDVDRHVPSRLHLSNGRERKLVYEVLDPREGVVPVLEVIIQQMFGVFETPKVCGMPVVLRLLSPARRPLQVTRDLEHFWSNSWIEICKEMRGRYPKHNWDYTDSRGDDPTSRRDDPR